MAEILKENVEINIEYNSDWNNKIVSSVIKTFDQWDKDRQAQLTMIKEVADLLSPNNIICDKSEKKFCQINGKKIRLKDADFTQIRDASIAYTYNATFKTPSSMFDVELETETESESNLAQIKKQHLLNILKKSKAKKEFAKVVANRYDKGESILRIQWTQKKDFIRRKVKISESVEPLEFMGMIIREGQKEKYEYQVQEQLTYDGIKIKCIEPEHFVFDVSRDDFDKAPKMHKQWFTYNEIKANEEYKNYLTNEDFETLKKACNPKEKQNYNDVKRIEGLNYDKGFDNGQIEVINYEGDFELEINGETTYYPNIQIVIIGRLFVGSFRFNPNITNSYIYSAFAVDTDTGRGIPKFANIIPYALAKEDTLNKIQTAIGLSINKCIIAKKGMFSARKIEVKEGNIIEIDDPHELADYKELDVVGGTNNAINHLQYLENKTEQYVSVYKAQMGEGSREKTATQAKLTQMGQDNLSTYELDIFGQFVLEMIEKIAELDSFFGDSEEQIKYKDSKGRELVGIIDDTIRTNEFIYMIGDSQSMAEKKLGAKEYLDALLPWQPIFQGLGYNFKPSEIVNIIGTSKDQENPEKILEQIQPQPQPQQEQFQGDINGINAGAEAGISQNVQNIPNGGMAGNEASYI